MPDLDFYLSEMAVSDATGGGLTVLRILGDDVDAIRLFVHLHPYGHLEGAARPDTPAERCRSRSLDLPPLWLTTPPARRLLGCRPAYWLSRQPLARRHHACKLAAMITQRLPVTNRPLHAFVSPQHAPSLYVLDALRKVREVDYVTWIMDDHLVRWHDGAWVYPPHTEELFANHLRHARAVFVISPAMADFYQRRFGVSSRVLFGPADSAPLDQTPPPPNGNELHLAYFGAISEWQLDALEIVARQCADTGTTLDIYSGMPNLPASLALSGVRFMGRISADQVAATMRGYHAVLLPISFLPAMRNMSELNIATKMSECLASGTPTLAIGPPYAAMIRFLQEHSAALCVTSPDAQPMRDALATLRNPDTRAAIAANARAVASTQLTTAAMRAVWQEGLAQLGATPP